MKLEIIKTAAGALKTKAAPVIFQLRKHAPEILVGLGVVSVGGGTVLACKATLEAKEILSEDVTTVVHMGMDDDGDAVYAELPEEEVRKEQLRKGAKVALSYLPAAGLLVGGTAMLVGAKSIEHRRLTAALGAYSSLQSMFETYRGRVISEHGPAADQRALTGEIVEKLESMEEGEDGKKPKKRKQELVIRELDDEDPFHRIFDECNCPHQFVQNLEENKFFLECWQTRFNQKLKAEGRVFLNDVYQALGFEYLPIGQFVGWVADDVEGSKDGFIDFGIDYAYLKDEVAASLDEGRAPEPAIWLNFNCDGEVWSNPLKKKHDA